MSKRRSRIYRTVLIIVCCALTPQHQETRIRAQESLDSAAVDKGDPNFVQQQIKNLADPSYRTRQLARWRLEQTPFETINAIEACLANVDYNTASQLVDLLSALATHEDVAISRKSQLALRENANRVSSVGRLADNAVRAIADLQEEQALQILTHHGAKTGLPGMLGFKLNAKVIEEEHNLALWIDDSFTGDQQAIEWIPFLKSVETIYLEGPQITSNHFRAVSQLPNIKNVKLKYVTISKEDLELLKSFSELELLELNYVNVDDSILTTLASLPISQSLRLYGTRITKAGAEQLAKQLDGIDIYCGAGGYLGVATDQSNTTVTQVIANSGAALAGIRNNDELKSIDGVAINNFADLRGELGKHLAGDKIVVSLRRPVSNLESIFLELEVTLGTDPN